MVKSMIDQKIDDGDMFMEAGLPRLHTVSERGEHDADAATTWIAIE